MRRPKTAPLTIGVERAAPLRQKTAGPNQIASLLPPGGHFIGKVRGEAVT
jgi:hypothetical protein